MDKDARVQRAILDEIARFQGSGMDPDEDTTIAFVAGMSIGSHLVAHYREAGQALIEALDRSLLEETDGPIAMAELDEGVKRMAESILPRLN